MMSVSIHFYAIGMAMLADVKDLRETVMVEDLKHFSIQVGVLTTWHRDLWAESFAKLSKDPTNTMSLGVIR